MDLELEPPDCWNDDTRMTVLFAPFRDKSLNTSSWNQKLTFWSNLIVSDCSKCNKLIIDSKYLTHRFTRKGKIPACIEQVIQEMQGYSTL